MNMQNKEYRVSYTLECSTMFVRLVLSLFGSPSQFFME